MNRLEQKLWDGLLEEKAELVAEVKRLREDNELYLACIHASQFRNKPGSAMSKLNQERFLQRWWKNKSF